jgi:hypothetical protein
MLVRKTGELTLYFIQLDKRLRQLERESEKTFEEAQVIFSIGVNPIQNYRSM